MLFQETSLLAFVLAILIVPCHREPIMTLPCWRMVRRLIDLDTDVHARPYTSATVAFRTRFAVNVFLAHCFQARSNDPSSSLVAYKAARRTTTSNTTVIAVLNPASRFVFVHRGTMIGTATVADTNMTCRIRCLTNMKEMNLRVGIGLLGWTSAYSRTSSINLCMDRRSKRLRTRRRRPYEQANMMMQAMMKFRSGTAF